MRQIFEDGVFHRSEDNFPAFRSHGPGNRVELKIADGNDRGMLSSAPPDQSFGARKELAQIKRFCNVVVGAGIEQLHDGFFFVAGAEYEHRSLVTTFAIADQEALSIKLWQHQVKNDQIVCVRLSKIESLGAVGSNIDGVAGAFT